MTNLIKHTFGFPSHNSFDFVFEDLNNTFSNTITKMFSDDVKFVGEASFPKHDEYKGQDHYLIVIDIPTVYPKESISVKLKEGYLTISGDKSNFNDRYKDYEKVYCSRKMSKFFKSFEVNPNIFDVDNIEVKFEGGVMEIKLPFKQKENKKSERVLF